jgi:RHS repeat-associated protein
VHLIIDVNGYFIEEAGSTVAYHVYYPFGEEATAFDQDTIREKFTGHERDLGNLGGAGDDLDYMVARHYSPLTARFLSVDLIGGNPPVPRSWNRYSYVVDRPILYTDPKGMFPMPLHYLPPTGMTLEDYGYAEGITVTGRAWRGTTADPNTGLWGLLSLAYGRGLLDAIAASGGPDGRPRGLGPSPGTKGCRGVTAGLTLELAAINPWSSGGGGAIGLDLQYVPGEGLNVYSYSTPATATSLGFEVGGSFTANVGIGSGAWEGDFGNASGGLGAFTGGGYYTPGDAFPGVDQPGVGWYGLQGGVSGGVPFSLASYRTNYKRRLHLAFDSSGCH